jgi:hypothetical protein
MDKRLSILPLFLLSVSYWLRDRFLYNRVTTKISEVSMTQWRTLLLFTPFFVFLQWILSEQILKGELLLALMTTIGTTFVSHFYLLGILNDAFEQTPQQMKGLMFNVFIQFLWTTLRTIVYARGGECA